MVATEAAGRRPGTLGPAETFDRIVLLAGSNFAVSGSSGDILPHRAHGVFHRDTRVLSRLEVLVGGRSLEPLGGAGEAPAQAEFVGRVSLPDSIDSPIVAVRRRYIGAGLHEEVEIRNFDSASVNLDVQILVEADFSTIPEVRDGPASAPHPVRVVNETEIEIADGAYGALVARVSGAPSRTSTSGFTFKPTIAAGGSWKTCLTASFGSDEAAVDGGCPSARTGARALSRRVQAWRKTFPTVRSSWPAVDHLYRTGVSDLALLLMEDFGGEEELIVAAGVPWFMTLFGRDSILTALMALPFNRELATGVMRALARRQGRARDKRSEEEPGKILHEVRFRHAFPGQSGGAYYGTVDATPLFVTLVGQAWKWGLSWEHVQELLPAVREAVLWMLTYGDRDGDGYLEYRGNHHALRNQGWKDSWDGIQSKDGRIPEGPIALCEVQGYKYMALLEARRLFQEAGDLDMAEGLGREATRLGERFRSDFWMEDEGYVALALDGEGRQVDAVTSNPAHLLWTGILSVDQAASVAARLVSPDLFSGWGLRTLSSSNAGYRPVSYQVGSVWPHDTLVAAGGLARAGFTDEALTLVRGLLAAAPHFSYRLPELFSGFSRREFPFPVSYPASCSPQAWSGASVLLLIRILAGLDADVPRGRLSIRPIVPPDALPLSVTNMQIGGGTLSFRITRRGVRVEEAPDGLELDVGEPDVPARRDVAVPAG
jgi:glycogen debranching enzyme